MKYRDKQTSPYIFQHERIRGRVTKRSAHGYWIRTMYGLTIEKYKLLLEKQNNKCALCPAEFADTTKRRLAVDRCHRTKKVRGLLCFKRNTLISHVEANPALLKQILEYLEAK